MTQTSLFPKTSDFRYCSDFLYFPFPYCSWVFILSLFTDVLGHIMKNITAKRSRARIVDKLLALGLVAERRELYKKRRKKLAPSSLVTVFLSFFWHGPIRAEVLLRSSPPRFFLPQAVLTRSLQWGGQEPEGATKFLILSPFFISYLTEF